MTTSHFGANVRRLREVRSWSVARLSALSDIHDTTIRAIEDGAAPSLEASVRLAAALGTTIDDLLAPPTPPVLDAESRWTKVDVFAVETKPACRCRANDRLEALLDGITQQIDNIAALISAFDQEDLAA